MHRQRGDVAAVEKDAAGVGRDQAGNLVDQRGLAGAVGADHGVQFAGRDVERHVVGDDQRAELLAQLLEAQHRFSHAAGSHSFCATPTRPPRANTDHEHEQRPEDHLPVLGEAGQPFLEQQKGQRRR